MVTSGLVGGVASIIFFFLLPFHRVLHHFGPTLLILIQITNGKKVSHFSVITHQPRGVISAGWLNLLQNLYCPRRIADCIMIAAPLISSHVLGGQVYPLEWSWWKFWKSERGGAVPPSGYENVITLMQNIVLKRLGCSILIFEILCSKMSIDSHLHQTFILSDHQEKWGKNWVEQAPRDKFRWWTKNSTNWR